ncbi:FAD/NAD(P)-binding protein [Pedobacter sp. L105]|uniref:FAD/NAD(P)-binding protein n=1 Tax=Pedobacter sp. L105 TaxID=1641871 RepID=UPI00131AB011|nr:FAD/NAD(P)-binding protein [Pedobacter sp. L105]
MPDTNLKNNPVQVTIIGGGFCGIMTAVNLMRLNASVHIHLINKGYPLAKGVAYAPHTSSLLLNVPNGKMSAYTDIPDHYIQWLRKTEHMEHIPADELATAFSTRETYGKYLGHLWEDMLNGKKQTRITVYDDFAFDIIEEADHFQVHLKEHPVLTTDYVVLATGNAKPGLPSGIPDSFSSSKYYFADPWNKKCMEQLHSGVPVLLIGNGLTMADSVIGLTENGFTGQIHTISPHGYQLKPWKETKPAYPAPPYPALLRQKTSLPGLLNTLNKHRKIADQLNQSIFPAVDALRPHTQTVWQAFSGREKQHFIKHLSHLWGSLRHRIPAGIHEFIQDRYSQGKLVTHKGCVKTIRETDNHIEVTIRCSGSLKQLAVQRVINCTGPDTKLTASELLSNLEKRGLICPDEFQLGIKASPENGCVINAKGQRKNLFVIGANLKGTLWESTAVPELRMQAQRLAEQLAAAKG